MPTSDDDYKKYSYQALLGAITLGDQSAREALAQYFRVRSTGRIPVVERDPIHGWRVRVRERAPKEGS